MGFVFHIFRKVEGGLREWRLRHFVRLGFLFAVKQNVKRNGVRRNGKLCLQRQLTPVTRSGTIVYNFN